jgi:hypothetical protein
MDIPPNGAGAQNSHLQMLPTGPEVDMRLVMDMALIISHIGQALRTKLPSGMHSLVAISATVTPDPKGPDASSEKL